MFIFRCLLGAGLLVTTAGCGFRDATIAVNEEGPKAVYTGSRFKPNGTFESFANPLRPVDRFVNAYKLSVATKAGDQLEKGLAFDMATTGYDLVDHYCRQFFQGAGDHQKWVNFSKDIITALGTLGTGVSALVSGSAGSTTAILALTTGTLYNGIDIYTQNFLFGAENITSVRALVVNALTVHRQATVGYATAPTSAWTFGSALLQIEDHQALCQSPKIKELVMQAIRGGTVKAFTPAGTLAVGAAPPPAVGPPPGHDPTSHVDVKASGN